MDTKIPTYAQAVEALERGDDAIVEAATLRFEPCDAEYVFLVDRAIRSLLRRPELEAKQLVSIGRALHGLSRLPLRTAGINIEISLSTKGPGGGGSYDFKLGPDCFDTEAGGYIDSGCGTDGWSGPSFMADSGGRQEEPNGYILQGWPDMFTEASGSDLTIVDLSDDSLMDWEHGDGSPFWEWIESHG